MTKPLALLMSLMLAFAYGASAGPIIYIEPAAPAGLDCSTDGSEWCIGFEDDSGDDGDCSAETGVPSTGGVPEADSGVLRSCDVAGTGSTPEGSDVLKMGPDDQVTFDDIAVDFQSRFDSGDSNTVQYGRGCLQLVTEDIGGSGQGNLITFMDGTSTITGSNGTSKIIIDTDATPTLAISCADDFTGSTSTAISLTTGTIHEINFSYDEANADGELCVDEAIGGGGCVTCNATFSTTNFDGVRFELETSVDDHDDAQVELDAWRFDGTSFGAVDGLCD